MEKQDSGFFGDDLVNIKPQHASINVEFRLGRERMVGLIEVSTEDSAKIIKRKLFEILKKTHEEVVNEINKCKRELTIDAWAGEENVNLTGSSLIGLSVDPTICVTIGQLESAEDDETMFEMDA